MTRLKGPQLGEPSFIEYPADIKKTKSSRLLSKAGINERYRELLDLRAQLDEAEGRLNGKSTRAPWSREL